MLRFLTDSRMTASALSRISTMPSSSIRRTPRAISFRATLYGAQQNDWDHVIADLSRVIEIDPTAVGAYLTRASEYATKNDYDHEIADLDQVIRLDPDLFAGYLSRAAAYEGKKDFDRAIADYNQTLKIDPKNSMAFNGRGFDYYNKKDYDRATRRLRPGNSDQSTVRRSLTTIEATPILTRRITTGRLPTIHRRSSSIPTTTAAITGTTIAETSITPRATTIGRLPTMAKRSGTIRNSALAYAHRGSAFLFMQE